jgi:hemolysin activation/secretion protein
VPINRYGTRFGGYYANGDFDIGGDLSALGLSSTFEGWGLSVTHPIITNRFTRLYGEFAFDLRDSKLNGLVSSVDRIRLLRAGLSYEGTDPKGLTFGSFYIFQGLGETFGGSSNDNPLSSRQGAGNSFTYGNLNLLRIQSFTNFLRGIFRIAGQVTSAPLVASEQFGLGGPDTVKGYTYKEIVGDSIFNVGSEIRVLPIPGNEIFQLSLGFDYGFVQQRKPAEGQAKFDSRMGYGPGIRLNLPFKIGSRTNYFSTRFDVGFPISPSKNFENERPVYYVATSLRF